MLEALMSLVEGLDLADPEGEAEIFTLGRVVFNSQ
jgi:hypothetical protein